VDLELCDRAEIELGIDFHAICGADIVPFGSSVQEMVQIEDCRQPDERQIEHGPLRLGPRSRPPIRSRKNSSSNLSRQIFLTHLIHISPAWTPMTYLTTPFKAHLVF
jgi:hypothetical protein